MYQAAHEETEKAKQALKAREEIIEEDRLELEEKRQQAVVRTGILQSLLFLKSLIVFSCPLLALA